MNASPVQVGSGSDITAGDNTSDNDDDDFDGFDAIPVRTPSPLPTPLPVPSGVLRGRVRAGTPSTPSGWVRRSANEIMADQAPSNSRAVYERAWVLFGEFLERDVNQGEPTEEEYIRYFDYLRKAKNYKSSSLWAIHSRVKNNHQRRYGTDPKWKRIYMQLQSYEANYVVKTANVFSQDEIESILKLDKTSPVWVMRKALAAVALCGGLRCCEVRNITLRDVVTDEEGAWVQFRHGKQRGAEKSNEFIVPFNREKTHLCYAACLISYMDQVLKTFRFKISFLQFIMTHSFQLEKSLPGLDPDSALFRRPTKSGFANSPIGRNMLGRVGVAIAEELGLENAKKYTGHCFR